MKNDLYNSPIYASVEERRKQALKNISYFDKIQNSIKATVENILASAMLLFLVLASFVPAIVICLLLLALLKYLGS